MLVLFLYLEKIRLVAGGLQRPQAAARGWRQPLPACDPQALTAAAAAAGGAHEAAARAGEEAAARAGEEAGKAGGCTPGCPRSGRVHVLCVSLRRVGERRGVVSADGTGEDFPSCHPPRALHVRECLGQPSLAGAVQCPGSGCRSAYAKKVLAQRLLQARLESKKR